MTDQMPAPMPLVFGPPVRRLFGWYHPARPEQARNAGVVLCNPLGSEALYTQSTVF